MRNLFGRRSNGPAKPAAIFTTLRSQVLTGNLPEPGSWAALMELGTGGGIASVVALSDGSTSLYTSVGGGIIGGGGHESVVLANQSFLATIERLRPLIPTISAADYPLPREGDVRFSVRWPDGARASAVASAELLAAGGHPLTPAFAAGHEVISALREVEESRT
jgi:hypothetical protein